MNKIGKFLLVLFVCVGIAIPAVSYAERMDLKGKKITMSILGIAGWFPSKLGVDMSPAFATYAKQKYGYDVNFTFEEAPFETLQQKAAASLATKSAEYNIIVSDSQWLGAFSQPGWIIKLNDMIQKNPALKAIQWYDKVVVDTYMSYPSVRIITGGSPWKATPWCCMCERINSSIQRKAGLQEQIRF